MASASMCPVLSGSGLIQAQRQNAATMPMYGRNSVQETGLCLNKEPFHLKYRSTLRRQKLVKRVGVKAAVATGEGSTTQFAKEMERVSAKEALLIAIKDAGGVEALSSGTGNVSAKIDVSEKVLALERLNPTPRPTTSPLLEGIWEFVWAGARSPGLAAARTLLKRLPEQVASLSSLTVEILPGGTKATAALKLLGSVETSFTLTTKLAVEGPLRLKEEYSEGVLATPVVPEGSVPAPLKGAFDQLTAAAANLPDVVKETLVNGLKLPLAGSFERQLLISYLDDEILVARDQSGMPDVLVRSVALGPDPGLEPVYVETIAEYES